MIRAGRAARTSGIGENRTDNPRQSASSAAKTAAAPRHLPTVLFRTAAAEMRQHKTNKIIKQTTKCQGEIDRFFCPFDYFGCPFQQFAELLADFVLDSIVRMYASIVSATPFE
jgi:hypothetical protein